MKPLHVLFIFIFFYYASAGIGITGLNIRFLNPPMEIKPHEVDEYACCCCFPSGQKYEDVWIAVNSNYPNQTELHLLLECSRDNIKIYLGDQCVRGSSRYIGYAFTNCSAMFPEFANKIGLFTMYLDMVYKTGICYQTNPFQADCSQFSAYMYSKSGRI